jgi:hypothetical protein
MADRSTDDVKRELKTERERLGAAVKTLRSGAETARRKLPVLAIGAAGAGFVVRTAARRVFRGKGTAKVKRARFPFLSLD